MGVDSPFSRNILRGKVALVTGGGSGIFYEVACQMGLHGANLVLMVRRLPVLLAAVLALESDGIQIRRISRTTSSQNSVLCQLRRSSSSGDSRRRLNTASNLTYRITPTAMAIGMGHEEQVFLKPSSGGAAKRFSVDMSKPMVAQVGHLGADYDEWVHQPVTRKESPRFFENDFLEFVTRTKWWAIPVVWGPVVAWSQAKAVADGLPASLLLPTLIVGLLAWTLAEYLLHRFLFHLKASSYWMNTFHYVLHGFHHKHPMDEDRLVFPPLYSLIIAIPLWKAMYLLVPSPMHASVCGGGLLGYICYDLTHYFLHFGTAFTDRLYKMKKDHSNHHFKNRMHNYGFGVTSPFWDKVFGTLPPAKTQAHRHAVAPVPEHPHPCENAITAAITDDANTS